MRKDRFYLVYVDGAQSPNVKHFDYDEAIMEAGRLAVKTGKPTYVLSPLLLVKPSQQFTVENVNY